MFCQYGHLLLVGNSQAQNHFQYEMGYTPKEFNKTLQGLFITQTSYSCEAFSQQHWQITVEGEPTLVDIKIEEAPPRVIALLTLPVLNVWFEFKETSEEQQADFIKTFFRYFHKGGG